MVGSPLAWLGCLAAPLLVSCAAGSLDSKSTGAACTRSGQCAQGLSCIDGSCSAPRIDAQVTDAGTDDDAGS